MKKRNVLCRALALCAVSVAVLLSSCKSTPDLNPVDPFDLLDTNASLYLTVPVQTNSEFVSLAIQKVAKVAESDADKITERLDMAYIAIAGGGAIQLSASGRIPNTLAGFALTEKNGWKQGVSEGQTVYTHQQTQYQLCLPSSSNAFLSRDVEPMLRRFNRIAYAGLEGTSSEFSEQDTASEKLLSEALSEKTHQFLHENIGSDIMLYSPNPRPFIKNFLGMDVSGGIGVVTAVLSQYRGVTDQFTVKLVLNMTDSRTVKATVVLLKAAMFGIPAKITQTGAAQITISDLPVSRSQIIGLLR